MHSKRRTYGTYFELVMTNDGCYLRGRTCMDRWF